MTRKSTSLGMTGANSERGKPGHWSTQNLGLKVDALDGDEGFSQGTTPHDPGFPVSRG